MKTSKIHSLASVKGNIVFSCKAENLMDCIAQYLADETWDNEEEKSEWHQGLLKDLRLDLSKTTHNHAVWSYLV